MKDTGFQFKEPIDFSLVQGGPLFQLLLRLGLAKPSKDLLARRIAVIVLTAWLPLVILTLLSGNLTSSELGVPFLLDLDAQIRCLVFIPLLLAAEVLVNQRLRPIVSQFIDQGIVDAEYRPAFAKIVSSAMRWRNSIFAELLLLGLSFVFGYLIWNRYYALSVANWLALPVAGQMQFTAAGNWYFFISLMISRFLLLRWYFRLIIWYRFLWQVSKTIPLRLNVLHPDRAGGLGFLANSIFTLTPVLAAHTIVLAGTIGGKIWHQGAALPDFKLEIIAWLIFLIILAITPLTFFSGKLAQAKRSGLRELSILASRYVVEFRAKWIEEDSARNQGETLIGSADIQSLADLANSYQVAREMSVVPFDRATIIRLAVTLALPLLPLLLTMIPFEQLLDRALGVFL